MNANKLWMSSEFKYRLKFSIWSFAFSAELNPSLKVELSSSRERVLPPWSKCCDLVSSLLKGKFLHKLWRFWQKYVSDVAKARMQLHYSALVSSPAVCSRTIQDRSLGSPVCSLGLLAGHINGDKAATAVPCVQTRVKITAELVSSQMKTGPGEWLAEFTATTEFRGMQRLKKNFSPLLCPRSSCKTCPVFCSDFLVLVPCLLNSEKDLAWKKEGIEETSWTVILTKVLKRTNLLIIL